MRPLSSPEAQLWSPSLRFKKNVQQQQQQQKALRKQKQKASTSQEPDKKNRLLEHQSQRQPQLQQQLPLHFEAHPSGPKTRTATVTQAERRSPKRRRTGSDPDLVSPEAVPQPAGALRESQPTTISKTSAQAQGAVGEVTPGTTGLDIRQFDFNLGQLDFLDGAAHHHHHPAFPQAGFVPVIEDYQLQHHQTQHQNPHPGFFGNWDQHLVPAHHGYVDVHANHLITPSSEVHESSLPLLSLPQRPRGSLESSGSSRRRARRHIALRASHGPSREGTEDGNTSVFNTPLHWMARLSETNTRLQALASLLPAQYEAGDGSGPSQTFPVDEMFQLTTHVADVLDLLCASVKEGGLIGPENVSGRPMQSKLDGTDPGSSMFVLSVYVMLLDLYHKVFTLVRSEVFQQASTATFAFWKLPDVTIGSFPVESTPSLQMSLTIQLAEEFLTRLRQSTATLDPARRSIGKGGPGAMPGIGGAATPSLFAGVVDASLHEIKTSEDSLRQELAALRDRIEGLLEG
ncbi:Fungal transcriptional regulatory protein [Sarocladium implicatum]|nr:Fungal transcriptional regulatory protein [Sarocladium implicatum]